MKAANKPWINLALWLCLFCAGAWHGALAAPRAPGDADLSFDAGSGADGTVRALAVQPDGKVLMAGGFTIVGGVSRNRIARVNPDGSVDATFNPGTGADNDVYALGLQPDGKVLVAGGSVSMNHVLRTRIARLNTNGSVDTTFSSGTGADNDVYCLAPQSDGKVLVGGAFTTINAVSRNGIARLKADGSLDTTFNPGTGASLGVTCLALQSDGKVLVGGRFTSINGVLRNRLARLNASGGVDTVFNPGTGADNDVYSLVLQADGKVLVGGGFASINSSAKPYLARLTASGSLDSTFNPGTGPSDWVYSLALQPDGKVLVGGAFTSINGTARNDIARVNTDGSLDSTFDPGTGANATVNSLALQPDGKVLLGGAFTSINSQPRSKIARLFAAVADSLTITNPPHSQTVLVGASATFSVGASGTAPLTYQWLKDGQCLASGTNVSYSIASAQFTDAGAYSAWVRSWGGSVTSAVATLTVTNLTTATLTVVASPASGGTVAGSGAYTIGSSQTISATANGGWVFTQWQDGVTNNSRMVTVPSGGATYTATFQPLVTLTVVASPSNGGSVSGGGIYGVGSSHTISAMASNGWVFTQWQDGVTNNPRTVTMPAGGATYTATFLPTATLTVVANPADGGTVSGGGSYALGSSQTISATANNNWLFIQWQDGVTNSLRTVTVPSGGAMYTATFLPPAPLTVAASPADGGTVNGGGFYTVGSSQTISALASNGWVFTQWQDGVTNNPRTVTVQAGGAAYTATFLLAATLTVAASPPNAGAVGGGGNYAVGSSQTISAAASDGWAFAQWQDGVTNNPRTVTLPAGGAMYTATFLPAAALTVLAAPPNSGLVIGGGTYLVGSSQTISAIANSGWAFTQWQDGVTNNPRTVTVPAGGVAYTATFTWTLWKPGDVDVSFDAGSGIDGAVYAIVVQPDGKVLVGGDFTNIKGVLRNRIARLNADGSVDGTFDPGTGPDNAVLALALQPDGKVLAGGAFYSINGVSRGRIARLNADGSLDGTFNPGTGIVFCLALQLDGKVLVGGSFTYINGVPRTSIARLNADGSVDDAFDPGTGLSGRYMPGDSIAYDPDPLSPYLNCLAVQPDGKVLVGGQFTKINHVSRNGVARLNGDGSVDGTFDPGTGANRYVKALALQPDGKVVVGGVFSTINGVSRRGIARLNRDGTVDGTFDPGTGPNDNTLSLASQTDGKVLVGGYFTSVNGVARNYIARLNADGSVDGTFDPGTGANSRVYCLALEPDGRVLVGGSFTSINNQPRSKIARLFAVSGDSLTITNQPPSQTVATCSNATFSVGASGTPPLTYQWLKDGHLLTAATNVSYGIPSAQPSDAGAYWVWVRSWGGSMTSAVATLTVMGDLPTAQLTVVAKPSNGGTVTGGGAYTAGSSQTISATANSGWIFAQWQDGVTNNPRTVTVPCGGTIYTAVFTKVTGDVDLFFNAGAGINGVTAIGVQPYGEVVVVGYFTDINGVSRNHVGRLNAGGSLDATFNPGTGADYPAIALALQPDGKVLVGGFFNSINGVSRNYVGRLNADGSVDAAFDLGTGVGYPVFCLGLQPDAKIVVGGMFSSINGVARNAVGRLNTDGTVDRTFDPGTGANSNHYVWSVASQSDGKVLVGGNFTSINGVSRSGIGRLNADGSVDATFDPGTGANSTVFSIALQPDGKVLVGGQFASINGVPRNCIARLYASGSVDGTFNPGTGADWAVNSLVLQPDGKVLLGGGFTNINGVPRNCLARLNADGSVDGTFNPGPGAGGANAYVYSLVLQPDGKVLVGGVFTSINDQPRSGIARLFAVSGDSLTITNPPRSQTVASCSNATFSVGVSGTPPLIYQWLKNGQCLAGATNAAYSIPSAYLSDAGSYSVWVRSWGGSLTSAVATLTVTNPLTATLTVVASPGNGGSVNAGGTYTVGSLQTISATANSGWVLTQWQDGITDSSRTVTVPCGGATYTATFVPGATLTVVASPASGGAVKGGGTYPVGSSQTISATASNGWCFVQWQDSVTNNLRTVTVPVSGAAYTATFAEVTGNVDLSFTPSIGDMVNAIAVQPDGKVLVGGLCGIGRLNADGTPDSTFDPGTGAGGETYPCAYSIILQADGKVLVGGYFTSINGVSRIFIARLNADGTLDRTFDPGIGANAIVMSLALQPDGKVLAGGYFTSINGVSKNYLARLNADGSVDSAFNRGTGANSTVYFVALQPDAKVLVGGAFTAINGVLINRIARLNTDGSVDSTFNPGTGANSTVYSFALQSDFKVLVGGAFSFINGVSRSGIARLNADGSLDGTFDPGTGANSTVYSVALQPDVKVLVGGEFTSINGVSRGRVARLNADGSLDITFNRGTGVNNPTVFSLALQPDGKVLVGGAFTSINNQPWSKFARLFAAPPDSLTITNPPRSQAVMVGSSATFTVGASGTPPLTYQWLKKGQLLAGATSVAYGLPSAQLSDAGGYSVWVRSWGGSLTSAVATLTVLPTLVITKPTRLGNGQFQFTLSGGPGSNYWVQVSSDLKTWTNFTTVTLSNGVLDVLDPSTGLNQRFYRAKPAP